MPLTKLCSTRGRNYVLVSMCKENDNELFLLISFIDIEKAIVIIKQSEQLKKVHLKFVILV